MEENLIPGIAHIIYIPGSIALGFVAGWVLGGRAMRAEVGREKEREERRARRRAERAERRAERGESGDA